jgi:NADH pyrophosphatase NudC (nudix superfamily)
MRDLPEDMIRNVAQYLPYNERVELNRILPFELRIVKKLNSDDHNLMVKRDLIQKRISDTEKYPLNSKERIIHVKKMFLYLLHTNDDILLRRDMFRAVVIEKARSMSRMDAHDLQLVLNYRKEVKSLTRAAQQLVSKLETAKFGPHVGTPKFVVIK